MGQGAEIDTHRNRERGKDNKQGGGESIVDDKLRKLLGDKLENDLPIDKLKYFPCFSFNLQQSEYPRLLSWVSKAHAQWSKM